MFMHIQDFAFFWTIINRIMWLCFTFLQSSLYQILSGVAEKGIAANNHPLLKESMYSIFNYDYVENSIQSTLFTLQEGHTCILLIISLIFFIFFSFLGIYFGLESSDST